MQPSTRSASDSHQQVGFVWLKIDCHLVKYFREPLPHCKFDVELLGDCDSIINQICLMLGEGWDNPVHRDKLEQHVGLPPEYYKAKESNVLETSKADEEKEDEKILNSDVKSVDKVSEELKSDVGEPSKVEKGLNVDDKPQEETTVPEDETKDVDEESEVEEEDHYSRTLAEYIPDGQFLFLPPARLEM